MQAGRRTGSQPITISPADVEREIERLFGDPRGTGLVIRVHGEDGSPAGRADAFRELLDSLRLYEYQTDRQEITVASPDVDTIATALSVLAKPRLQRRLFERILLTFGKHIVDPLGQILDTTPGGALFERIAHIRDSLTSWIADLKLTFETQSVLSGDISALLSDDYLSMLAEHEETVQRPRVVKMAREILHLVGVTFERAFRQWPEHARSVAEAVHRRMGSSMSLRESPVVIRERIVDGIAEFLWIETGTELIAAVGHVFSMPSYRGITDGVPPDIERSTYQQFAEACWEIIAENC